MALKTGLSPLLSCRSKEIAGWVSFSNTPLHYYVLRGRSSASVPTTQGEKSNGTSYKENKQIYTFCHHCQRAWRNTSHKWLPPNKSIVGVSSGSTVPVNEPCQHDQDDSYMEFTGIHIVENFVTEEEEKDLDNVISATAFMKSQSGRRKQDFGPKVNFKKQKLKTGAFNGLPSYSRFLYNKMKTVRLLEDFEPVEMCNLEYSSDRGAHIDPHIDDTWVWGEKLVTLNLLSNSFLSFTTDSDSELVIQVPLLQRSLIIVYGCARYEWKHSIDSCHISGRRLAMTFRELSPEFNEGGLRNEEGETLLKLALTFNGCAVGSAEL